MVTIPRPVWSDDTVRECAQLLAKNPCAPLPENDMRSDLEEAAVDVAYVTDGSVPSSTATRTSSR